MAIEALLAEIRNCMGVTGAVVFDASGSLLARAGPDPQTEAQLSYLGKVIAQTFLGVERARRRKPASIDLVFAAQRLIVRPLAGGFLGIVCAPRINVALLDLNALPLVRGLQQELDRPAATPPADEGMKAGRLKAAVQEALGEHAHKALEILAAAGPAPADLARAAEEIEAVTRIFIDRKKAAEIARTMRSILEG